MAVWACQDCTTAYSVGAPACPHCGSTDHMEADDMGAKITRHGGPSYTEEIGEQLDTGPEQEGEQSSPGSSSSASTEKPQPSTVTSSPGHPSPAPTTVSRSSKARTGSSGAASTDGGHTGSSRPAGGR